MKRTATLLCAALPRLNDAVTRLLYSTARSWTFKKVPTSRKRCVGKRLQRGIIFPVLMSCGAVVVVWLFGFAGCVVAVGAPKGRWTRFRHLHSLVYCWFGLAVLIALLA